MHVKTEKDLRKFFGLNSNELVRWICLFKNDYFNAADAYLKRFLSNLNKIRVENEENKMRRFAFSGCSVNDALTNRKQRDYKYVGSDLTFLVLISRADRVDHVRIGQVVVPCASAEENDANSMVNDDDSSEDDRRLEAMNESVLNEKLNILRLNQQKVVLHHSGLRDHFENVFAFQNVTTSKRQETGRVNKESMAFEKYFPGVKLVGLSGYSQIGHDCLPYLTHSEFGNKKHSFNFDIKYFSIQKRCCIFTLISLKD